MEAHGVESLVSRNGRAVLAAIQSRPRCSRADVARATGLSTSAVSALVTRLIAAGLLVELGANPATGGGRPSVSLGLAPRAGSVIGIHLGHADLRVVLTSLDGTLITEQRHVLDVDHEPAASLDRVARSTADLLTNADADLGRVLGLGVAVSAPVVESRQLGSPPMLLDWGGVDIGGILAERTGLPVHLGNDASLGALAEWRLGAGTGFDDVVYVMLGEGVGCGLILGGRLHTGASGMAGELGHLSVVPDGKICRCGARGCLETLVSKRALVSALAHTLGPAATVESLLDLADAGDRGALRLLADAGQVLGTALAGVCTITDPRLVVIGGDLTARPDSSNALLSAAGRALDAALPPVANHDIRIVRARLGARAEALGAALLAASRAGALLAETSEVIAAP
ncbi:ROK family transcriptional regulator [Nocardioides nematodiphilus]|uniref:ROK family transcriptional regulator n=1 Tax=Nocardioides nematodiphilus TaxID=2849669 RepID=UPI001CDA3B47|nr:ROK family transcriptional regulator [Nocardioides nematodiphilus]MCA1982209.1 ROK family transcriptional regulator [Nocardioides nematodiphilus]